ncbi:MAG: hypothetical protein KF778_22945 [Rhodocyclaceae bacterium]|nr:hypothetical protein [Rhodocyclaceae bacterium]
MPNKSYQIINNLEKLSGASGTTTAVPGWISVSDHEFFRSSWQRGKIKRLVLPALDFRRKLATKGASLHGCKRTTAALTAIGKRTLVVAVSRVRFAGLKPALVTATTEQNMRPIFGRC